MLFVALLAQAARATHLRQRRFLQALALVPLIRLMSLSLPLAPFTFIDRYVVIGASLLLAALLAVRAAGLDLRMAGLGLRKVPLQFLIGLSGALLGYVKYQILCPAPLVADLRLGSIWLPALTLLVFTGFVVELIFHGVLQYTALQQLGRYGILYATGLYTRLGIGFNTGASHSRVCWGINRGLSPRPGC